MNNDIVPKSINDVARPGKTAAQPYGKPVITGAQNQVSDPMMASPSNTPLINLSEKPTAESMTPEEYAELETLEADMTAKQSVIPNKTPPQSTAETKIDDATVIGDTSNPDTGHSLVNNKSMFGEMKPKRSKKILYIVLVLLILIGGGLASYKFIIKKDNKNVTPVSPNTNNAQSASPSVTKTTDSSKDFVLPKDFVSYDNTEKNLHFAYPKIWGSLTEQKFQSVLFYAVSEPVAVKESQVDGKISITLRSKTDYQIQSNKYGYMLEPKLTDGKTSWVVKDPQISANPNNTKYKTGDKYEVDQFTSKKDVVIFDFPTSDEGCIMHTYVYETKTGYAELNTPAVCDSGSNQKPSAANIAKMSDIAKNIIASVIVL